MILLYTLFGFVGGYVSARTYKAFNGESWKQNIAYTPIALPGIVFATFFLLNLFLWAKHSSGAVPFTTMLVIVAIWFIISVPLSVAGSWLGFKQPAIEPPVRTNQIPRQIPPSSGYLRPLPSMLSAGIIPFWAIFVELYFIMNSLWFHRIYYMFGFLFIAYGLMIIVCAAVTVLMVYFLLCTENYHWQWRSFFMAGTSALYVFAYALIYWVSRLKFGSLASGVLYLGYSALISFLFFVLTGKYSPPFDMLGIVLIMPASRYDRLFLIMGFRSQDLRIHQGRLTQALLSPCIIRDRLYSPPRFPIRRRRMYHSNSTNIRENSEPASWIEC